MKALLIARFEEMFFVGPPRIELGPYAPEAHVLPAYSGPIQNTSRCAPRDSNPWPFACEANALTN